MAYRNKIMQTNDLLNYYLTMNMNNICRICLEKSNKLTPIFDPIKPPHFSVLIMACASVQVEEGDGLPLYICQRCISRLNIAYQFKTQCESSDVKLRQCFENYNLSQAQEPNYSVYNAKETNVNEINHIHDPATQEPQPQHRQIEIDKVKVNQEQISHSKETSYSKEISTEQEVTTQEVEEEIKYSNANVNVIHFEAVPDDHQENRKIIEDVDKKQEASALHPKFEEESNSTPGSNESINNRRQSKKASKTYQCPTCGKTFRTKPSLVHHVRIHTGERPYVCHLCHKRFVNGGHLHTHMKTHTGEKNHICAVCNKGFATSQQLTKHTIAIHTSERPYGCTYCPKRFASSSNLNTHIKIHTGEKNYHCEICGKTFSTKGQLQQHMLVHTGEKAFLCEYCNKSFSQKAHLLRHLRTHTRTE